MADRSELPIKIRVRGEDVDLAMVHALGAAVRTATLGDRPDPYARFLTPAFTQELLEHLHRAKKKALADAEG